MRVRLQPAGRADTVLGLAEDADGMLALKATVTKAPEGGKANQALIKVVAKSTLEVVQGHTSRTKVLHLAGDANELADVLNTWAAAKGLNA